MRNVKLIALLFVVSFFAGCNDKKAIRTDFVESEIVENDTTVYGKCGNGTAMHTLELINDNGDTLVYSLENADTCANIQGGVFVGDRLAVIEGKNEYGELFAKKVINITSLIGKWGSLNRNFDIQEGGVVAGSMAEPQPYTEWKILNGHLVLSNDTFDIYMLGPDSLYLENKDGIFGYKRLLKNESNTIDK